MWSINFQYHSQAAATGYVEMAAHFAVAHQFKWQTTPTEESYKMRSAKSSHV